MMRRGSEGVDEGHGFDCTTSKAATCTLLVSKNIKKQIRL
jgi:hypothetical protein